MWARFEPIPSNNLVANATLSLKDSVSCSYCKSTNVPKIYIAERIVYAGLLIWEVAKMNDNGSVLFVRATFKICCEFE